MSKKILSLAIGLLLSGSSYAYTNHEVSRSETLWGIAYKYKVSPEAIIQANPEVAKGLKPGMIIRIPDTYDSQVSTSKNLQNQNTASDDSQKADNNQAKALVYNPLPGEEEEAEMSENVYIARFGDSLFSVAQKTGISVSDLLRYNPLVDAQHLPEGYIVRLSSDAPYIMTGTSVTLVDSIIYRIQPPVEEIANERIQGSTVAVMLPFDVSNETISRQSLLATDFYKGFLMAVKKYTDSHDRPVKIIAIDTQCDQETLNNRLKQITYEDVDVIIPPEEESQLNTISKYALENNIMVLNVLNIKDESYLQYPNVLQTNISQKLMYEKAISALLNDYSDFTPVILNFNGGKDDKSTFVEELKSQYDRQGRPVMNLTFDGSLKDSDIKSLPSSGRFIFIPRSGTADVFNRISESLVDAIESDYEQKYKVFGYPEWITFRGDQEEMLHRMGAVIYSRFYADADDYDIQQFDEEFIRWYGNQMVDVYPSQGILGYDIGNLVLNTLDKKRPQSVLGKFESGSNRGLQSTYRFIKDGQDSDMTGLINDSLYIIEFMPGSGAYVRAI